MVSLVKRVNRDLLVRPLKWLILFSAGKYNKSLVVSFYNKRILNVIGTGGKLNYSDLLAWFSRLV